MKIYKSIGINGKELLYVYSYDGQRYIYKERKKTLEGWMYQMAALLTKAKYNQKDIQRIISYLVEVKGYWQHENFYIKPYVLVQNLNDLGGVENLEFV